MIALISGIVTGCVGISAADLREVERLLRASYGVRADAHAIVLADSPSCHRIARAAGYADRKVTVIKVDRLYAVVEWDEIRVLDRRLQRVAPKQRKPS